MRDRRQDETALLRRCPDGGGSGSAARDRHPVLHRSEHRSAGPCGVPSADHRGHPAGTAGTAAQGMVHDPGPAVQGDAAEADQRRCPRTAHRVSRKGAQLTRPRRIDRLEGAAHDLERRLETGNGVLRAASENASPFRGAERPRQRMAPDGALSPAPRTCVIGPIRRITAAAPAARKRALASAQGIVSRCDSLPPLALFFGPGFARPAPSGKAGNGPEAVPCSANESAALRLAVETWAQSPQSAWLLKNTCSPMLANRLSGGIRAPDARGRFGPPVHRPWRRRAGAFQRGDMGCGASLPKRDHRGAAGAQEDGAVRRGGPQQPRDPLNPAGRLGIAHLGSPCRTAPARAAQLCSMRSDKEVSCNPVLST